MSASRFESMQGSIPALATPITPGGEFDAEGLERLVNHVIDGGVGGFNVLGSSGEFSLVPPRVREPVIRTAIKANAGRVPMIVACGRPSVEETRAEIAQAEELGADGVLVNPSYYYPLTGDEVRRFFHGAREGSSIPIMYYHIPQMTKVATPAGVIGQLHADGILKGIKDSSGVAAFLARVITLTRHDPGFRATVGGPFYLAGSLEMGACGVTGMLGTVLPHFEIAIIKAWQAGDKAGALEAQARLHDFQEWLAKPGQSHIARAKAALEAMGVCGRDMWPPMQRVDDATAKEIAEELQQWLPGRTAAA